MKLNKDQKTVYKALKKLGIDEDYPIVTISEFRNATKDDSDKSVKQKAKDAWNHLSRYQEAEVLIKFSKHILKEEQQEEL